MVDGLPLNPSSDSATSKPTSAARSISGASGTGSRTPTTVNHCPPRNTSTDGSAVTIPRRSAATDPSTTAG